MARRLLVVRDGANGPPDPGIPPTVCPSSFRTENATTIRHNPPLAGQEVGRKEKIKHLGNRQNKRCRISSDFFQQAAENEPRDITSF